MTTPTIRRIQDVTLAIETPALQPSSPHNVSTLTTPASLGGSTWTVTLTRQNNTLAVGVLWYYQQPQPQTRCSCYYGNNNVTQIRADAEGYCAMHLVSRKTPSNVVTVSLNDTLLKTAGSVKGK